MLKHLAAAGIQNTRKKQRLEFSDLEPSPKSEVVHCVGRYEENGKVKRAAVCIGPRYGTVTRSLMNRAARDAVDICDLLIVMGFAFEAQADENLMKIGELPVWRVRMNTDLHMSERLAAGKSGNLFVAFGEPDIVFRKCREEGMYETEIRGLDIFDPTTGDIKSADTRDIACWMLDTDYNGESFFTRHAYFCGEGIDPYKNLKRAMNADIDPEAWASLYSSVSLPFPAPSSGSIAVKAINHLGDEVMKVFSLKDAEEHS